MNNFNKTLIYLSIREDFFIDKIRLLYRETELMEDKRYVNSLIYRKLHNLVLDNSYPTNLDIIGHNMKRKDFFIMINKFIDLMDTDMIHNSTKLLYNEYLRNAYLFLSTMEKTNYIIKHFDYYIIFTDKPEDYSKFLIENINMDINCMNKFITNFKLDFKLINELDKYKYKDLYKRFLLQKEHQQRCIFFISIFILGGLLLLLCSFVLYFLFT